MCNEHGSHARLCSTPLSSLSNSVQIPLEMHLTFYFALEQPLIMTLKHKEEEDLQILPLLTAMSQQCHCNQEAL